MLCAFLYEITFLRHFYLFYWKSFLLILINFSHYFVYIQTNGRGSSHAAFLSLSAVLIIRSFSSSDMLFCVLLVSYFVLPTEHDMSHLIKTDYMGEILSVCRGDEECMHTLEEPKEMRSCGRFNHILEDNISTVQ